MLCGQKGRQHVRFSSVFGSISRAICGCSIDVKSLFYGGPDPKLVRYACRSAVQI